MISVTLTDQQNVTLSIAPTDADGDQAVVQNIVWSTTNPDMIILTPNEEDPLSCLISTVGAIGQAEVKVVADADLGDGVVPLEESAFVTVIQSMATSLNLLAGMPTQR